ncbi:hypothetical protein ACHQM5_023586 [Ranunculus cassubicifolius]
MEREESEIREEELKSHQAIQSVRERKHRMVEREEIEIKDEDLKSHKAVNYVKAFSLLSSIKSSQNHQINTANYENEDLEKMLGVTRDLKMQVIRERVNYNKVKLYHLAEFIISIVVMLGLLSVVLLLLLQL